MRLIVDGNSILKTCLGAGDDVDQIKIEFEGKIHKINSSDYGYENMVNSLTACMEQVDAAPKDIVFAWDGANSSKLRLAVEPRYKSGRDSRPPEYYQQYQALRERIVNDFCNLGSISVHQDGVEADDIIGYLCDNSEEDVVVMTNDNDLSVLVKDQNDYGARISVRVNGVMDTNKYGPFDFRLITLYKSTVGDQNDSIVGVPGFGDAKFLDAFKAFKEDGMLELLDLFASGKLDSLHDLVSHKPIQLIWENQTQAYKSYFCAKLHPEWVNTKNNPLVWRAGVNLGGVESDERLKKFCQRKWLVTADRYDELAAFLVKQMNVTPEPSFDIETSTPEDSDDWLEAQGKAPGKGVDVIGSYLCGFSITFGRNNQWTYYVPVKHYKTANVTMKQARLMIESMFRSPGFRHVVIQNTMFEGTVLYNAADEDGSLWRDHWKDLGERGFIPKWLDTKLEASYVDENSSLGLKQRSESVLGYQQTSYDTTTTKFFENKADAYPGGRVLSEEGVSVLKQYKMHELPASDVFAYGCDDTICTSALHNFYKLFMQLEHTWEVYKQVEIDAAYLHTKSFVDGVEFSLERMKQLEADDKITYDTAWAKVRTYLMKNGWEGTVPPVFTQAITAAEIKQAYRIVTDQVDEPADDEPEEDGEPPAEAPAAPQDPFLSSRVRTPSKLVALARECGHTQFADMLQGCLDGRHKEFTEWVLTYFKGEPNFKISNKQMCKLLYEVMALPIRIRGKPTEKMKQQGIREGNPKANDLAIDYALRDCDPEQAEVLNALKLVQMVKTRRSLFYVKYPALIHWKTGRIHPGHNQCAANTRRASSSDPNVQQLPTRAKIKGYDAKFRETIRPHRPGALVVSVDESAQELRLMAEHSRDPNLMSCYIGDNKRDVHLMTGLTIAKKKDDRFQTIEYSDAHAIYVDKANPLNAVVDAFRGQGKTTNFGVQFGAMAEKLSQTMKVSEDDGQDFIDAYEETFPGILAWKETHIAEAKDKGYVTTLMGARRHLAKLFNSADRWEASKAERQAVNFAIQGSGAEMVKLAEGRIWRSGILDRYDCAYYMPVHDECVMSVAEKDLVPFSLELHSFMVEPYANMTVPIESSLSFGPDFYNQTEVGAAPTAEKILSALQKIREVR